MSGVSPASIAEHEAANAPTLLESVFGQKMSETEQDKLGKALQNERAIAFWQGQKRGQYVDLDVNGQIQAMFNRVNHRKVAVQRPPVAVKQVV